ncbi:MAG: hypothetical protein M1365_03675 [Actinobacteria bacterium]|nr:hypothetical protein [Actinomycetota bacterium]
MKISSCYIAPRFITRKIVVYVRELDNLKFLWRAGKAVVGHLMDFGRR